MAKRDGEFAKTKTDWHRDPRCIALKYPAYKWLNQVLWNLCVKERRDTLPTRYSPATLAREAGVDVRTVRKALTLMQEGDDPLITVHPDQSITVHGVREIHENKKFKFLDVKRKPVPPRVEESKSRVEESTVAPATSPPNEDILQDPYMPEPEDGIRIRQVREICELATTIYKNTQMPHEIQPAVFSLLNDIDFETLKTAIQRASDYGDRNHRYRKGFAKCFPSGQAVKEWAEQPATPPQEAPERAKESPMDKVVREYEEMKEEEENDEV